MLLERDALIEALLQLEQAASREGGRIALVLGEAGIGKTSLVDAFLARVPAARVLRGGCEALFTPRPLGPLYDIAENIDGELARALDAEASRQVIFGSFLRELGQSRTICVFEDVHWADEATLDLLKFIGRRIHGTRSMLLATYRDDEIGARHPLRYVTGDLPPGVTQRLRVPPLSRTAVAELARAAGQEGGELFERTGGNAFYVTEMLAARERLPESIRDAVLARTQGLPREALDLLELVAVIPGRAERWLTEAVLSLPAGTVEQCLERGVLLVGDGFVGFRHELAREAIEDSMPETRRRSLHLRVLEALGSRPRADLARLVHHADAAASSEHVLRHAPAAGRRASALGAHRESAAHYRKALKHAIPLPPAERRPLLAACAYECYLIGEIDEAVTLHEELLEEARAIGDHLLEGEALRWLSRLSWFLARRVDADRYAVAAIEALEQSGPSAALAMAYSNLSQLNMLSQNRSEARRWGEKALELADRFGALEIRVHALNNIGTVQYTTSQGKTGQELLEASLKLAVDHDLQEHAARAWTNLASNSVWYRDAPLAERYLHEGVAYCVENDLDTWRDYMHGWQAFLAVDRGRWEEAAGLVVRIVARRTLPALIRLPSLVALARLAIRRGDSEWEALLTEAEGLARPTREPMRLLPLANSRIEAAWYAGDLDSARSAARAIRALALEYPNPWEIGELSFWAQRLGIPFATDEVPIARPWEHLLHDRWREAAQEWRALGFPFEQARALEHGDESAQREALRLYETLGAAPALASLRQRMRSAGMRAVPRGPRASTRHNPRGLTGRQLQVLECIAAGMTDAQIGAQLHLSTKTVGHHVSAILAKLEVASRSQAAGLARREGLLRRMG